MPSRKRSRLGNPASRAEAEAKERERLLAAQAAAVAQRESDAGCTTGCCG